MSYTKRIFIFVIISVVLGVGHADLCSSDTGSIYCAWGCCGDYDFQYCCDYYGWSSGSIAGASIGAFVLIVVTVVVILCCRRRRLYSTYWGGRPATVMTVVNPQATVSTVSSTNTNVAYPSQPQFYPAQPPPYPGGQYPAQY